MPSGSRPLTGSSKSRIPGSPSSAPAMPRRCPMPSEYFPARRSATPVSPTTSSTSSTRAAGMSLVLARQRRWLRALRPGWKALASSSAPTSRSGQREVPVGDAVHGGRSRVRHVEAEDHAHGGGLAGAVGAEEAGHEAGSDGEAEAVDGEGLAVALRQGFGDDHGSQHAGWRGPMECRYRASRTGASPRLAVTRCAGSVRGTMLRSRSGVGPTGLAVERVVLEPERVVRPDAAFRCGELSLRGSEGVHLGLPRLF